MSTRHPRQYFTNYLRRVCKRLDGYPSAEFAWHATLYNVVLQGHGHVRICRIWVFGSYARGATTCGDLDLIVEIEASEKPPEAALRRAFFAGARDVSIYVGTPDNNESGFDAPGAMLIWAGSEYDWRAALDGIKEDPTATRFPRAIDRLPFNREQIWGDVEMLEEIEDAEARGVIKWAFSPLPDHIADADLDEDGVLFKRNAEECGRKTCEIALHVYAYLRPRAHWFGRHLDWEGTAIDWGGCRILTGTPAVPIRWLEDLSVFELVIAPHKSQRHPNGIWSIARGPNHPISRRLEGVEFYTLVRGEKREHLIEVSGAKWGNSATMTSLYRTEAGAQKAAAALKGLPVEIQLLSGDNLLATVATCEMIEIDGRKFARNQMGRTVFELDQVSTDEAILDALSNPAT